MFLQHKMGTTQDAVNALPNSELDEEVYVELPDGHAEKSQSRPWKCPELNGACHTLGWPSERGIDRHFSDKHAAAPPTYQCLFVLTSQRGS